VRIPNKDSKMAKREMPKRRRAPGGGRKPAGPFSELREVMSIRVTTEMRDNLAKAAKANNRSVTQELLARLDWSFKEDRKNYRDPAARAFCFLFSELAELVHWNLPNWETNRFLFRAFKFGISKLLGAFEPGGKIKAPPGLIMGPVDRIARVTRSPAALADYAVSVVLANYNRQTPSYQELGRPARKLESLTGMVGLASEIMRKEENVYYGMNQARKALTLKPRGRKS
jgi:hypothetical protein